MLQIHSDRCCNDGVPACMARNARRSQGFTLTETLVATILLLLATSVVAMGVSLAQRSYRQQQFLSQSEVLASTINNALADPFRFMTATTATDETSGEQMTIYYIRFNGSSIYNPSLVIESGTLHIRGGSSANSTSGDVDVPLINEGAYGGCRVVAADGGTVVLDLSNTDQDSSDEVKGSYVIQSSSNSDYRREYIFSYKPNQGVTQTVRSTTLS